MFLFFAPLLLIFGPREREQQEQQRDSDGQHRPARNWASRSRGRRAEGREKGREKFQSFF